MTEVPQEYLLLLLHQKCARQKRFQKIPGPQKFFKKCASLTLSSILLAITLCKSETDEGQQRKKLNQNELTSDFPLL